MQVKKSKKLFFLSLASAAVSTVSNSIVAKANGVEFLVNADNAKTRGLDISKIVIQFNKAGFASENPPVLFKMKFHEEDETADIFDLDGFAIRVNLQEVRNVPPNFENGSS